MTVVGAYAAKTDTGKKRRRNEDAFVLAPPLFAVAYGMGGAQAGEVASKLAAAALEDTDPGRLTGPERVASLIQEANRRVHERSSVDPATSGMGTTMTVALVENDGVVIGSTETTLAALVKESGNQVTFTGDQLDLVFVEDRAYRLTVGRGLGRTLDLMRELAAVEPCQGHSFDLLAAHVLEHAPALSGCILVLLRMDEQRRALVRRLRGLGVHLLVLVMGPERPRPEDGVVMHAVNPRDVGAALRTLSW